MKSIRMVSWVAMSLSIVGSACQSELSCEDLATCPYPVVSSSSSGTTTTSGGSSGTLEVSEDCLNGMDDDENGAVDCADAACLQQFACVPAIPQGFSEIVTMAVASYGSAFAACADGSEPKRYYQEPAQDACDGCACTTGGMTCTPAPLFVGNFFDNACMNLKMVGPVAPGQCGKTAGGSAMIKSGPTVTGTCQVQTIDTPLLPPMKTTLATCLVAAHGGQGCGESGVCIPSESSGAAEYLCVKRAGHETCPSDWPVAIHAFDSFTDDRAGCTPCSCSASCTGGQYTVFPADNTCMTTGTLIDQIGTCVSMENGFFGMGISVSPVEISCAMIPGKMVGAVQPQNETTLCCR